MFINGAAGNLAPIYSVYPSPKAGHLNQFRVLLGDKILEANKKILSTTNEIRLVSGGLTVETPRKPELGWPADLGNYTATKKDGTHMVKLPVRFLKINDEIVTNGGVIGKIKEVRETSFIILSAEKTFLEVGKQAVVGKKAEESK